MLTGFIVDHGYISTLWVILHSNWLLLTYHGHCVPPFGEEDSIARVHTDSTNAHHFTVMPMWMSDLRHARNLVQIKNVKRMCWQRSHSSRVSPSVYHSRTSRALYNMICLAMNFETAVENVQRLPVCGHSRVSSRATRWYIYRSLKIERSTIHMPHQFHWKNYSFLTLSKWR